MPTDGVGEGEKCQDDGEQTGSEGMVPPDEGIGIKTVEGIQGGIREQTSIAEEFSRPRNEAAKVPSEVKTEQDAEPGEPEGIQRGRHHGVERE